MPQAGLGGLGPFADALQFLVVGVGEQRAAVRQSVAQPGRAEVIRFADQHGRPKPGIGGEVGRGPEDFPANREILLLNLLLQRDGVRRDDQLAALVGGVNDARKKVGEGFADPGAGLEQQRLVIAHGGRDRLRHPRLLRAVLQVQRRAERSGFGENVPGQLAHPGRPGAGFRGRGGFVGQTNHGR